MTQNKSRNKRENEVKISKLSEDWSGNKRSSLEGAERPLDLDELEERLRTWILHQREQRTRGEKKCSKDGIENEYRNAVIV